MKKNALGCDQKVSKNIFPDSWKMKNSGESRN